MVPNFVSLVQWDKKADDFMDSSGHIVSQLCSFACMSCLEVSTLSGVCWEEHAVNFVFLNIVMRYQVCLYSHSITALAQNNIFSERFCIFYYFSTYFIEIHELNMAHHTVVRATLADPGYPPMPENWYQVSLKSVLRCRTSSGWIYPSYPYRVIFTVQVWGYVWPWTRAGTANQD
jgi:hypothetical protein